MKKFDILVIGGGHAGLEASWLADQFDLNVGLVSMAGVPLASTPCNPSIGGVGKGQVVREIDALGGLMPRLADLSGLQYRTLNESKGYAVQSTRVQVDKDLYPQNAERIISEESKITVIREKVSRIKEVNDGFEITTDTDICLQAKKIIVTTGTFLSGQMHRGEQKTIGGRVDCDTSAGMDELFPKVGKLSKRFKTGTPPRLDTSTINYDVMVEQKSDPSTRCFYWENEPADRKILQKSCFIAHTNEQTLGIIRSNKERSPIFNGQIKGVGPRYCPSIEDKAFRYLDRDVHHVFIEPEGLTADTVYPNGISTSLPIEVQEKFVRTIPGLEKAEILVHGYAVEYDVVDTTELRETLEHKEIEGLYFAGQVCGTSGYEEAAGQGVMAGINAALSVLGKEPLILPRNISYIGVLIQDLVTNTRDEPYRLFTARSEDRLVVREDNAVIRIAPFRKKLGLKCPIDQHQSDFLIEYDVLKQLVTNYRDKGSNKTLATSLRDSKEDPVSSLHKILNKTGFQFSNGVTYTVAIETMYEGYINKNNAEKAKLEKVSRVAIDWQKLSVNQNISNECRSRINKVKPENFGQLRNIEGIRPATLAFVAGTLR